MRNTENYSFNLPEGGDFYSVEHSNENFTAIDRKLKELEETQENVDAKTLGGHEVDYFAPQTAIDNAKTEAKGYTDEKIADLINGAPTTLDTLKEIADAMAESEDVVEALNEAIGTKANATHKHTKSDITDFPSTMTPSAHNQSASTVTAGTLGGKVVANATAVATLGDKQVRNIYVGETALESGVSALPTGDIYIKYK